MKEPPRKTRSVRIKDDLWSWASRHCRDHAYTSMAELIEELIAQRRENDGPQFYVRRAGEGMVILPVTMVTRRPHRLVRRELVEARAHLYRLMDEAMLLPGVSRVVLFQTDPVEEGSPNYIARVLGEAVLPSSDVPEGSFETELDATTVAVLTAALDGEVVTYPMSEVKGKLEQRFKALGTVTLSVALVHEVTPRTHIFLSVHVGTKKPLDDKAKGLLVDLANRMKRHVL